MQRPCGRHLPGVFAEQQGATIAGVSEQGRPTGDKERDNGVRVSNGRRGLPRPISSLGRF